MIKDKKNLLNFVIACAKKGCLNDRSFGSCPSHLVSEDFGCMSCPLSVYIETCSILTRKEAAIEYLQEKHPDILMEVLL